MLCAYIMYSYPNFDRVRTFHWNNIIFFPKGRLWTSKTLITLFQQWLEIQCQGKWLIFSHSQWQEEFRYFRRGFLEDLLSPLTPAMARSRGWCRESHTLLYTRLKLQKQQHPENWNLLGQGCQTAWFPLWHWTGRLHYLILLEVQGKNVSQWKLLTPEHFGKSGSCLGA